MSDTASLPKTVAEFVRSTADQARGDALFELETEYMLQVNLSAKNPRIWMKLGAMVAYRGNISFEREGMLDRGLGHMFKKAVTGEGATLTKATGEGALYIANKGKRISLLMLEGESLFVNGNDMLAIQDGLTHDITMMRKLSAIMSGGLFNVKVSGRGTIAITTHHRPVTLRVERGRPVFTDPQATVAWSGGLQPDFKTDMQLKTFLGRGSGESFQMKFEGDGFVIVQPYEEDVMQHDS